MFIWYIYESFRCSFNCKTFLVISKLPVLDNQSFTLNVTALLYGMKKITIYEALHFLHNLLTCILNIDQIQRCTKHEIFPRQASIRKEGPPNE